ncbi:uncharacterized protein METZ01_LOCUS333472, partial [marine metagenome]
MTIKKHIKTLYCSVWKSSIGGSLCSFKKVVVTLNTSILHVPFIPKG